MPKISVVVSSINEKLRNSLLSNIERTIGCDFEFLYEDNTIRNDGLCTIYNRLAEQAQGDFLCFVHEDVIFYTPGWGKTLVEKASEPEVGVLGFAGTQTVSRVHCEWWCADSASNRINLLQGGMDWQNRESKEDYSQVLVLDGFFLFVRKNVWNEIRFDETNFPKYHYYDMDFTFNVAQQYENFVCNKLTVQHLSIGRLDEDWFESGCVFCKKWSSSLPKSLSSNVYSVLKENEKRQARMCLRLKILNTSLGWKEIRRHSTCTNTSILYMIRYFALKKLLKIYHTIVKKK